MSAGRPCKYEERMKSVSLRLPESLYIMALGKAMAQKKNDITFSELVRDLLEEYTHTEGFDKEAYDKEKGTSDFLENALASVMTYEMVTAVKKK